MKENFLHFIWKYQYFQQSELMTTKSETIQIKHPGFYNYNAGPDFLDACILINNIEWHGHVEIHIKASDWYAHQHETNNQYDNVILHVVLHHDREVIRNDNSCISCLVLEDLIDHQKINNYEALLTDSSKIACKTVIEDIPRITKLQMLDRVLLERIERKSLYILEKLKANDRNWEEVTYQILAEAFGFKINNSGFQRLSSIIPARLLRLHAYHPLQNEALLLGTSGLLPDRHSSKDPYVRQLHQEYNFLAHKYQVKDKMMMGSEWNYLRLRPANFPTIRIAQLSCIMSQIPHLCSAFLHIHSKEAFYRLMDCTVSEYWESHYQFGKVSPSKNIQKLGKSSLNSLIINVIVPLQFAYGIDRSLDKNKEKALDLLESIPPENNKITRLWKEYKLKNSNSLDSQSLIELFNNYCTKKRCLECSIGHHLITKVKTCKTVRLNSIDT
ncbi:DUF2851 family protein [Flammeovirga agarivorans]|uniref:DUF2851 family protein n=1 Tax=Flammeovirga agarivorans TaxID=2726742 RepID=A0A7X8SMU7_9BACT|nr:DUF2851 family protein [Flammeovirga agarivorans]NLR93120.1 DUF2851 family protein [Flammeovirga agarivorans]